MPVTRTAFVAAILAAFLLGCDAKKNTTTAVSTPFLADTLPCVTILPEETLDIKTRHNQYITSVTQKFIVAKNRIGVIQGKKGLRITINPAVLEKEDGIAVDGPVQVNIVELTSSEELFAANAATMSNGRLLASGGSYFIGMTCNGEKLKIKTGNSLEVEFPKFKDGEMELFYGSRDEENNMNWIRTGLPLTAENTPAEETLFTDSSRYSNVDIVPAFRFVNGNEPRIYRTTQEQVYYYDKKVTIKELVDTINRHTAKIYLDTVDAWPRAIARLSPGSKIDSNFLYRTYGPPKQFIIKLCRNLAAEDTKTEKQKEDRQRALDNWKPQTLAGQLQKYYSSSKITTLGWINCDRFYGPSNIEMQLELPGTFVKSTIHYFLIYKSFNGLMSGTIRGDSTAQYKLCGLPGGEAVKLVAFIKHGDKIYQCQKDFAASKNAVLQTELTEIANEEMKKIFGTNVKI